MGGSSVAPTTRARAAWVGAVGDWPTQPTSEAAKINAATSDVTQRTRTCWRPSVLLIEARWAQRIARDEFSQAEACHGPTAYGDPTSEYRACARFDGVRREPPLLTVR